MPETFFSLFEFFKQYYCCARFCLFRSGLRYCIKSWPDICAAGSSRANQITQGLGSIISHVALRWCPKKNKRLFPPQTQRNHFIHQITHLIFILECTMAISLKMHSWINGWEMGFYSIVQLKSFVDFYNSLYFSSSFPICCWQIFDLLYPVWRRDKRKRWHPRRVCSVSRDWGWLW